MEDLTKDFKEKIENLKKAEKEIKEKLENEVRRSHPSTRTRMSWTTQRRPMLPWGRPDGARP